MGEVYEVRVSGGFSAVHQLRMPDGSVEPLHGHDWKVQAIFRGARLDAAGLLIDFDEVSHALREVLADLQHANLNNSTLLGGENPSTERVAKAILERLSLRLGPDRPLAAVYVEEAPGCVAGYLKES